MFWFDLDNSPHVPLFRPIFSELEKRNRGFVVTARDFAQTKDLLTFWNIKHVLVDEHGGKSKLKKVLNLLQRSHNLVKEVKGRQIDLAISHGSRTQLVAARRLGIPSVLMLDYEYTETKIFNTLATHLLMPSLIPDKRLLEAGFKLHKVIRYEGFKEEIYLKDFVPDVQFRKVIGVDEQTVLVTLRPPSTVGNYHDERSERLFQKSLKHFSSNLNAHCLIVNRTRAELNLIPEYLQHRGNISVLRHPVDGLQLIWNSDVVISGGGTMNRESALLGVPTFSIFTGRRPYLDEYLREKGLLTFIENSKQLESIPVQKRSIGGSYEPENTQLASQVTQILIDLAGKHNISVHMSLRAKRSNLFQTLGLLRRYRSSQ